jgi:hypothetical protein
MATVLIQSGDHHENHVRILPLALECLKAGHKPVILVYKPNHGLLFWQHGIETIALDQHRQSGVIRAARRKFLSKRLSLASSYRGIKLGQAYELDKMRNPSSFKGHSLVKKVNAFIECVDAMFSVLDECNPAAVYIWNGKTGIVANVLRLLSKNRKIACAFMERGLFPGTLFIDQQGVNGYSNLQKMAKFPEAKKLPSAFSERIKHYSPQHPMPSLKGKRFILCPLQVEDDSNIHLHSDSVKSMRQLCMIILNALENLPADVIAVIRPHPEEDPARVLNLPIHDRLIVTDEGNLRDWIVHCSAVVTINSTVGLEAAMMRKGVVLLGRAIYSNCGFVHPVGDKSLAGTLRSIISGSVRRHDDDQLARFLSCLNERHLVGMEEDKRHAGVSKFLRGLEPSRSSNQVASFVLETKYFLDRFRNACLGQSVNVMIGVKASDSLNITYKKNKCDMSLPYINENVRTFVGFDSHMTIKRGITVPCTSDPVIVICDPHNVGQILHGMKKASVIALAVDKYFAVLGFAGDKIVLSPALRQQRIKTRLTVVKNMSARPLINTIMASWRFLGYVAKGGLKRTDGVARG